jgi:NAD(P)-dependent dehydrogenase (short-subunit alcohol dehydrogenase family)
VRTLDDLFSLKGKIAFITGGSRGLGREIALAYAACGADVVVASRKLDACTEVSREIESLGRRAMPLACHMGDWDAIDAAVRAVYDEWGRIDILVNNAGMSPLAPSSAETSEDLFDKVVAVNLKGPFRLAATVGQRMYDAGDGVIINVSSTGALRPAPHIAPYAASKAGLNALTEAFAKEFGPRVRVNTLSAGPFLTDVSAHWAPEKREQQPSALGRPGRPEEVVTTALYLASPASSYTSGALVRVDGGLP